MKDPIDHLPGVNSMQCQTDRLKTSVLVAGQDQGDRVMFLHGNLSAATFWEETMIALADKFRSVAPDQRGFGLSDRTAQIDATRGVADWAEDAIALADHLGWQRFHLVGHSLGGCIAWSLLGSHSHRLGSVTLVAPGPPSGFPGARGQRGELNHEDGAGSGAGLINPRFADKLKIGERDVSDEFFSPRSVMNRVYWKPPFRPQREEQLLTAMLQVHLGEKQYPGDWISSSHWPGFAPGSHGPINALSPRYNQGLLDRVIAAEPKPPLLWIQGTDDAIVSDQSLSDPGQQGKLRLRADWPGDQLFPPQPLLSQVKFAFDQYEQQGGVVNRLQLSNVGHTPYLERPAEVQATMREHLVEHCS